MKKVASASLAVWLCAALAGPAAVGGEKTVTLVGKVICAKCALGEEETCQNVLVVETKKGKEKHYYLTRNDAYQDIDEVCQSTTFVRVTGKVKKEDGRLWLAASVITPLEDKG